MSGLEPKPQTDPSADGAGWPRISVVTPSFNQVRFLEATLRSIHDPGYPNLEHIVLDGGSTDGSRELLAEWSPRFSFWVSEPDEGQTAALQRGLALASGDVLCWLNSDDLFEPSTLFEVGALFRSRPQLQFVYGDSLWIDEEGRPIKTKREHRFNSFVWLWDHNFIPQPSTFWRRGLYEAVGGVDRHFNLAMDADLWIRMAQISRPVHVRRPWSRMRFYGNQKNTRLRAVSREEMAEIRSRYVPPSPTWRQALNPRLARALRLVLKATALGYGVAEIRSQSPLLIGRGSWEQRRLGAERGRSRR